MKRMKDCLAEKDPAQVRYPEIGEQKRLIFSVQVSSHMVLGAKGQFSFAHLEEAKKMKIRTQNPDTFGVPYGFDFWSSEVRRIKDEILCECKDYLLNVQ